ncbi:unnamed protein product, partial [Staurois parvus]
CVPRTQRITDHRKSRRCRLSHVISCVQSQLITWDMYTDHKGTDDQCALMISVAPAVPPVSVHQCTSMPHISAHLSCLSVPPISASQCCLSVPCISAAFQCPSMMPVNASSSVPPISVHQCSLSVPISAASLAHIS